MTTEEPVDDGPAPFTRELARWSEALAAIARTGLGFTESLYERERFEEVLHIAADMKVAVNEVLGSTISAEEAAEVASEQDHFVQEWLESVGVGVPGYVTPKVAIGAIVGNDAGRAAARAARRLRGSGCTRRAGPTSATRRRRSPSRRSARRPASSARRSASLAVVDGQRMGFSRFGMYMLIFHCMAIGGELQCHPLECADVGWFARDALPEKTAGVQLVEGLAFAAIDGEDFPTIYDEVRTPIWRS